GPVAEQRAGEAVADVGMAAGELVGIEPAGGESRGRVVALAAVRQRGDVVVVDRGLKARLDLARELGSRQSSEVGPLLEVEVMGAQRQPLQRPWEAGAGE